MQGPHQSDPEKFNKISWFLSLATFLAVSKSGTQTVNDINKKTNNPIRTFFTFIAAILAMSNVGDDSKEKLNMIRSPIMSKKRVIQADCPYHPFLEKTFAISSMP